MNETGLRRHLQKCEIEYRANHSPRGDSLDWLAPHCGSTADIVAFLREIGFKIKEIVDGGSVDCGCGWVVTTGGIVVYVNTDYSKGFFWKQR